MCSGGTATVEDDIISTATVDRMFENIQPKSYVYNIGSIDDYDLDFLIFLNFNIIHESIEENISFIICKNIGFMG